MKRGLYVAIRLAVVIVGLSLGIALRQLAARPDAFAVSLPVRDRKAKMLVRLGVGLNMLEPPAIVITLGLCLGLQTLPLTWAQAWQTFAIWVVPALFVAAGGEALWIGVGIGGNVRKDEEAKARSSSEGATDVPSEVNDR